MIWLKLPASESQQGSIFSPTILMNKMDFLVEGSVGLLSVIPQPRNMAGVCSPVVWILCNVLLALLLVESSALLLELSRSTTVGAFALVRLLLRLQSGLTATFSCLVRVWARAGEQAGPVTCLQYSRSLEGRSWSCVLFSMTGRSRQILSFSFSYSQ